MPSGGDVETFVRVRPPGKDGFGNRKPGPTTELDVEGCLFAPGPSWEMNAGANQVEADGTVFAPSGVDVVASDQMRRANGDLYEVIGRPRDWGARNGVEIVLKLVKG